MACRLWCRHRADPAWRAWAHIIGAFAVIVSVMLIPFVVAFTTRNATDRFAGMAIGLVERSMFVTLMAMTVVLVLWARTFTGPPHQAIESR